LAVGPDQGQQQGLQGPGQGSKNLRHTGR
jgi:hypothetical protein